MRRIRSALLIGLALLFSGCLLDVGLAGPIIAASPTPTPTSVAPVTPITTSTTVEQVEADTSAALDLARSAIAASTMQRTTGSLAGRALGSLDVYAHPADVEPDRTVPSNTILGTPTVVRILGRWNDRLHVALPGRPNGATGWINESAVEIYAVDREVVVDLSDRWLQVLDGDDLIYATAVGVGSPSSPTPTGSFYVTDAAVVTKASGPWGPFAFGLSARSNAVTEFNGGDGIIGIHGTNKPWSIGHAQSLGCIRLNNDRMAELFDLLSVGTPVEIRS